MTCSNRSSSRCTVCPVGLLPFFDRHELMPENAVICAKVARARSAFLSCAIHNFRMLPNSTSFLGAASCFQRHLRTCPLHLKPLWSLSKGLQSSSSRLSIFGSCNRRLTRASKVSFMSWTCLPSCADAGLQLRSSAKARTLCSIGLNPWSLGSHHRIAVSSWKRCAIRVRTVGGKT